jgi:hypothetical protein
MSNRVAEPLIPLGNKRIRTAAAPDEAAMLARLTG